MQVYLLLLVNIAFLLTGQILWKYGVGQIGNVTFYSIITSLFSPLIFGGLVLYGLATLIWLFIISKGQFSIVYPLQSIAYVLGVFVAWLIFKESIPITRWIGVLFVFIGIIFITKN
jgi:drug/metabolite transporter (DMT)-like permease